MRRVLAAAGLFAIFAIVPTHSDTTKRSSAKGLCKPIHIYDPLNIRKCMQNYFDLCPVDTKKATKEQILGNSSAKFGMCLGKSIYSVIFNSSLRLPTKSQVCNNKLTTNMLNVTGIDKCSRQLQQICDKWDDKQDARNLLLILPFAKCILQKEPTYRDPSLWKEAICSFLEVFHNETMPVLLKVVRFADKVMGCERPPPPPAC